MKKLLKFISLSIWMLLLSMVTVFGISHTSHYELLPIWYSDGTPSYSYTQRGTVNYQSAINQSVLNWNNVSNNVDIYKTTSSADFTVISDYYGNVDWYGQTSIGMVKLNDTTPSSNRTEMVTHEFGHVLGLDHYDCDDEVMRELGFKGSSSPYTGDKNGIYNQFD